MRPRPVKICYVVTDLGNGGAQKQLRELITRLDPRHFEPLVINLHDGLVSDQFEQVGRIISLAYRGRGDGAKTMAIAQILRRERPDILHCFLTSGNFYGLIGGVMSGTKRRIAGERSVGNHLQGMRRRAYAMTLKTATVVVTNSSRNKQWLHENYKLAASKVLIIKNGCAIPSPRPLDDVAAKRLALGVAPDEFLVGTATHLSREKDVSCLVAAIHDVVRSGIPVRAAVVGSGPLHDSVRHQIDELGIADRVALLGYRPHAETLLLMQALDCFVLPSRVEGMPNALMEAMALGVPSIASDVGGVPELIEDRTTGLLFSSGDSRGLANQIRLLRQDAGLRQTLGERARVKVQTQFTVESMVAAHHELYGRLLSMN
jgi:glycosyltransferase involved in cell wall biosynthesis